jgi:hypothetical protein
MKCVAVAGQEELQKFADYAADIDSADCSVWATRGLRVLAGTLALGGIGN